LVAAAADGGIEVCFANPGTSEVRIVGALDAEPRIRPVLGLFEGVATGAADGYGRIAGRPAMSLLHLGPGLANGLANLHNARRAGTPIVSVVGEQPGWHLEADSPITSDVPALAATVSRWVRTCTTAEDVGADVRDAVAAAAGPPAGIATLLVPMDLQWTTVGAPRPTPSSARAALTDASRAASAGAGDRPEIAQAAHRLRNDPTAVLVLGGRALRAAGLRDAARIEAATGCRVYTETFPACIERGRGIPWFRSVPYFPEHSRAALGDARTVITAGAPEPVHMFGDPDGGSGPFDPSSRRIVLAGPGSDAATALRRLAEVLGVAAQSAQVRPARTPPAGDGLDPRIVGAAVAAAIPEGAIVVDEAGTSAYGYTVASPSAAPHTTLGLTGGAIGMGLPVATGAAVAAPDRRVIALQADGSALYTVQSLWTLARESLDVTVVLLANQRYGVLGTELERAGQSASGPASGRLIDLANPQIDWVALGRGLGVPGTRATTSTQFSAALDRALSTPGPALIEAILE
jgi:acetolactate synthase-1/2/3 large subunit